MHKLKIETLNRGNIELSFQNFSRFVWVAGHQLGIIRGYVDDPEEYCNTVSKTVSNRFQQRESLGAFDNLNSESIILDIGSGVGIIDIVLHKYLDGGNFILVDESIVDHNHVVSHWSDTHGFYNDWNLFKDIAINSGIDMANFTLQSPGVKWPEKIDLIMSSQSYLWHYPLNVYLDELLDHPNSSLLFDILNRPENNMERLNILREYECEYIAMKPFLFHWFENELLLDENNSAGKICYWK